MNISKICECLMILICIVSLYGVFSSHSNNIEIDNKQTIEIAKVISAEACNQGLLGMWLVGNTIDNRSKLWNKTHYKIITQRNQYYGYTNPNKEKIFKDCEKDAMFVTNRLIENKLGDATDGAIYYLLPHEKLRAWHKIKTITYKDHTFYKEK